MYIGIRTCIQILKHRKKVKIKIQIGNDINIKCAKKYLILMYII